MLRLLDTAAEKLLRPRLSPMYASVQRDHGIEKAPDPRKAALAVRIRMRTTAPNAWIAEQLQLGHVSRVTHCARTAPPELLRKLESAPGK